MIKGTGNKKLKGLSLLNKGGTMNHSRDDIQECIKRVKELYPKRRLVPLKPLTVINNKPKPKRQNLPI